MRAALALLALTVLTALAVLLVLGDGPGSRSTILVFSRTHGVNLGDIPVALLWLVGVGSIWGLSRRSSARHPRPPRHPRTGSNGPIG